MQAVAVRVATLLAAVGLLLPGPFSGNNPLSLWERVGVMAESLDSEPVDVALDPGHSTRDVGATGASLREHEVTLAIAREARLRLEVLGYRVRLTRETAGPVAPFHPRDATEAIRSEQGARHAVAGEARAYVSIHLNGHPNRALRGTETYFNSENFGAESRRLAESLQGEVLAALTEVGYTPVDRGVREDLTAGKPYGHFFSLRGPFPSALVEALFLSNGQEAAVIHDKTVRDAIAEGITRGIASYLDAPRFGP